MYNNLNDIAALQMLLSFMSVKELTEAAMNGFSLNDSVQDKENANLCYKVLKAYLDK